MPLDKDPQGGGTNADGSKSSEYCSLCFANGQFYNSDFTAVQMQAFCVEKMQEMGMPKFVAWLLTRNIPRLKRWKK